MVRGALTALIELELDLTVVAMVDRGDAILSAARESRPDVAIIDIDLPVVDGLTAKSLRAAGSSTRKWRSRHGR